MLYKYENSKIDDFVVMDINNIEYKFSMLIGNERKLIFKYNKSNCISCIDSELNNFIAMSDKFGIDNMVILGEHDNIRELNAFLEERKCEINAYLIKSESGSISHILSEENLPFVFMIDSRLVAECVFIPIKEIADYSESYYKNIYNRFFVEALPAF